MLWLLCVTSIVLCTLARRHRFVPVAPHDQFIDALFIATRRLKEVASISTVCTGLVHSRCSELQSLVKPSKISD